MVGMTVVRVAVVAGVEAVVMGMAVAFVAGVCDDGDDDSGEVAVMVMVAVVDVVLAVAVAVMESSDGRARG